MNNFKNWWMEWAFNHSKPNRKRNYDLGEAVVAAYEAGFQAGKQSLGSFQSALRDDLCQEQIAWIREHKP